MTVLAGVGVAVEQPAGGHHHPRRAEPALQAVALHEALLHRVEAVGTLEALDGVDGTAVGHHAEHRAALHRCAVEVHDAGAAVGGVAAPVGAGEPEVVAQQVHEQDARLDVGRARLAVDGDGDVHPAPPRARSMAVRRARSGQLPGEVALVLGRSALVGGRVGLLGGQRAGPLDELVGDRLAAQRVLGGRGAEVLGADGREPDADVADLVPVEPDRGARRGDRPVAGAALDLAVGAAGARADRHADLGDHLGVTHRRLVRAPVELPRRHRRACRPSRGSRPTPAAPRTRPRGPRSGRPGRASRRWCPGCARRDRR